MWRVQPTEPGRRPPPPLSDESMAGATDDLCRQLGNPAGRRPDVLAVRPKRGRLVLFYSRTEDGRVTQISGTGPARFFPAQSISCKV